jgi:hypothetical protein
LGDISSFEGSINIIGNNIKTPSRRLIQAI